MKAVTSNIKCNPEMPQEHVLSDCNLVAPMGDVHFGQEIEIDRYKNAWRQAMAAKGLETFNLQTETPISFDKSQYVNVRAEVRFAHRGYAHITPERYVSVVHANRKSDCLPVAFMSVHYVNGAFHHARKFSLSGVLRRRLWAKQWKVQQPWITELLAQGYTVIVGGDYNRVDIPQFAPGTVEVAGPKGIDHLHVIPAAGVGLVSVGSESIHKGLHTDHPALIAEFNVARTS